MKAYKSSNKNRRKFIIIFIGIILLFFISRAITGRLYKNYKTVFPTYTNYIRTKNIKGINIFDEKIYYAEGSGISLFNASEGQKVPVGFEIASINLMNDTSGLKDDLIRVNAALNYKNQDFTKETVTNKLSIKNLQDDIKNNNLSKAIADINEMDIYSTKSISISELTELLNYSEDALLARKKELAEQISNSNISYYAENSGIVSFLIDNLEKKYNLEDFDKYTYDYINENLNAKPNDTKTKVEINEPLFKLINNLNYYIAIPTKDLKSIGSPEEGQYLTLNSNVGAKLTGKIVKINTSKNGNVIILYLNSQFDKIYKNRINNYSLVLRDEKCFEIPNSAIIKRDNLFGVYVQEIHGLVRFIPIKVIRPLENSSYVSKGDKNSYIRIDNKTYRTISINDSIVLTPKQVDESEVLN
ncbi:MAG: HlyD family efflux transporter periplasmic adaptor subunit [Peptoniphilus sp.]|nr:HlyD family efflux transporter periplasmic adaptor subunit [Peptoniphilus sp.]